MPIGGQPGNKNAKKSRMFEQALIREIKQRDLTDGEGETLRKIAAKWVDMALSGELMSGKEIRDTLDGKPNQSVTADVTHSGLADVLGSLSGHIGGPANNT